MNRHPPTLAVGSPRAALIAASFIALALTGCAVGPDFHRPAPPTVSRYTPAIAPDATDGPSLAPGQDLPAEWWTVFGSRELDALVKQALAANPDLAAARAALRSAQESYLATRGALWPTVGFDYNATRQLASATPAPPLSDNQNPFTLHTAQLSIAYTLDVFGGLRRQAEAAGAQAEQQRFETEAAYLSLSANVVVTAIQAASLREQVKAQLQIVDDVRRIRDLMRRQLAVGDVAGADLAAQETVLAQAEAAVPPLEKQLALTRDLLADLTGQPPGEAAEAQIDLASILPPQRLPLSLPAKLVEQRPDIRAAEANLHAASANVGVAIAQRLPNISLAANAGGASQRISDLLSNGDSFWLVSGSLAQPLFAGGSLRHRQKAAEAALDQAQAQYRSAVLAALQNVADVLQALDTDGRAFAASVRAETQAERSLSIARRQLELGQVAGPVVLTAEQAYQATRQARIQAEAGRDQDAAALFQALGGGWWNRPGGTGGGP